MWQWLRRLRGVSSPADIPDPLWRQTLAGFPLLATLTLPEQARLRALAAAFLARKEFHGAQDLQVTDAMALAVAAQACLPLLHLGPVPRVLAWYDDFVGIVLHPDEVLARREQVDENGIVHQYDETLAGEAMAQGPVMLSWHDVALAGASAATGYNVVIHEFLHKMDQRDGAADGCPPLPAGFLGTASAGEARRLWLDRLGAAYETFREQVIRAERFGQAEPWLDPYGAHAIDEFFAVAGEAYFVNRARFAAEFPMLVELFDAFFRPARAGAFNAATAP